MKGAAFEREICKKLSLWFSRGQRDDIFWRTHASGARATQHRKQGKTLINQEGDITAIDVLGEVFCKNWVVSLKTGYCRNGYYDTLDIFDSRKKLPIFIKWWWEIKNIARLSNRQALLIFRRERRKPVVITDVSFPVQPRLMLVTDNATLYLYALSTLLKIPSDVFISWSKNV